MQMESTIQEELCALFDSASARGPFATHWRSAASDLRLEVSGVGAIRFPVSKATVRALRSVARPARFGRGEETVLDRRLRDTWVISKSRVKIDGRRWRQTLGPTLERIHAALELPRGTRLEARLHDMLVYEEGQFFVAHRDAEKTPDMVGTLVVLLPSSFRGGASVVTHQGERVVVGGCSRKELTFLAFFSDCEHEVKPVEHGHRVALTYELGLEGTPATEEADPRAVDAIRELVRDHFDNPVSIGWRGEEAVPDRLVYLLDHDYTPRGLSWRRLKGADASRAAMLRQVADELECEVRLATAEVHEQWSCEPDDAGYRRYPRYGYRREWVREDPVDEERDGDGDGTDHPPLTELHDTQVVLGAWRDDRDRSIQDGDSVVQPAELCYSRPSDELTPFRFEHEGYMGNWGDTVDRWYHRAAVVLWPRSRGFVIRGKHAPAWAAARVRETLDAGEIERAREMVRELLPHWPNAARSSDAAIAVDVLCAAHGLDDAELAAAWSAPLRIEAAVVPDALASLVRCYGVDWLESRVDGWIDNARDPRRESRAEFQRSLPGLTQALPMQERAVRGWLHRRLEVERKALAAAVASAAKGSPSYRDLALAALAEPFVAVFRAAILAGAKPVQKAMAGELAKAARRDDLRSWGVVVLRRARKDMTTAELEAAPWTDAVGALRRGLTDALAVPPRDAEDWSIDAAIDCKCALCGTLRAFLSDRDRRALDWPLAKLGRQHVHGQIDMRELPVTHATRRKGSPHTLELRKTDALFGREREARERMQDDLAWLAKWPG